MAGGPRKNSGRKKGSLTTRTQELVAQAAEEGVTPIEVLLDNMRFWYDNAQIVTGKLTDFVSKMEKPEDMERAVKLLDKMVHFRDKAQACAVDAAPYVHPRLAQVKMEDPSKRNPVYDAIAAGVDPKVAAEHYRAMITA